MGVDDKIRRNGHVGIRRDLKSFILETHSNRMRMKIQKLKAKARDGRSEP
jgi:hypothetical protein